MFWDSNMCMFACLFLTSLKHLMVFQLEPFDILISTFGVGRKTYVRGSYRNWFGHAPTPIWFCGHPGRIPHEHMLMGLAHERMPMGLAHEHVLMGLVHEHLLMGLAHRHMLMEPDPGPDELKSRSGQHIRTSEFDQAQRTISKMFENWRIWLFPG